MNNAKNPNPAEIAALVADRLSVDWAESGSTDARTRRVVENLHRIDRIGWVYETTESVERPLVSEGIHEKHPTEPIEHWGPLVVHEQIQKGGFGKIYLAYDPDLKKHVALKFERDDPGAKRAEDTFIREAQKLAKVRHENVLTVHGVAHYNGKTGIWTDLIHGFTLEELLAQQGTFGAEEAAHIGIEICRALAAVHRAGLIHNDVKTLNVMRERGGKYILMDFGAATRASSPEDSGEGLHSGTPLYMAPESLQGKTPNVATDVYALGVVLFRLVSLRYPIEGRSQHELRENHRAGRMVRLRDVRPELSPGFVHIVQKAVMPDPAYRYQTVGEMENALFRFLSPVEPPVPKPERISWMERSLLGALGVVGLALVAHLAGLPDLLMPFDVEASLFRARNQADERLTSGSRIAPGDQLFVEIKGSRDMHVYALNQDEDGRAHFLFPLSSLDAENPLEADRVHRLPGTVQGTENYWDVTSAGGEELLFIVVSRKPVPEMEAIRERLAQAGSMGPVEIPLSDAIRPRSIGGMSPHPSETSPPQTSEVIRGLALRSAKESGLWKFEFRLPNPR